MITQLVESAMDFKGKLSMNDTSYAACTFLVLIPQWRSMEVVSDPVFQNRFSNEHKGDDDNLVGFLNIHFHDRDYIELRAIKPGVPA